MNFDRKQSLKLIESVLVESKRDLSSLAGYFLLVAARSMLEPLVAA
jgi:hypothetical protein